MYDINVEEVKQRGWVRIPNIIPELPDLDPHQWFQPEQMNYFDFPEPHTAYRLRQYSCADETFRKIYKGINERLIECGLIEESWTNHQNPGLHELKGAFPNDQIPLHADIRHKAALTIFLNHDWDKEDGGWNLIIDNNGDTISTPPTYNLGVFYYTPLMHATTAVWRHDLRRRTMQIFYGEEA